MKINIIPSLCVLALSLPLFAADRSIIQTSPKPYADNNPIANDISIQTAVNAHNLSKQILILDGVQEGLPQPTAQLRGIMDTIENEGISLNNIFIEHLDLARNRSAEHRANLVQLLRHKLLHQNFGLIIAINQQSFDFLANDAKDLLPEVPAILTNVQKFPVSWDGDRRKIIDIFFQTDVAGTLRYATSIFPKTRRLVVINGHDDVDVPFMEATAEGIRSVQKKLEVEYTGSLSYEEMLEKIATLPSDTIAFLGTYFNDRTGRKFVPAEVAKVVAGTANVPVFAQVDILISQGLVGGSTVVADMLGKRAAEIAVDYLHGKITLTQPVIRFEISNSLLFNWQQLDRWGINANLLPANTIYINRPLTLWEQHKLAVISTMLTIAALLALILALILQNRLRRKAELIAKESEILTRESEERYRTLFNASPIGIGIATFDGCILAANTAMQMMTGYNFQENQVINMSDLYLRPNDRDSALKILRETGRIVDREVKMKRKDGSCYWAHLNMDRIILNGDGVILSNIRDITAHKQAEAALKESEQHYRKLFDQANEGLFIMTTVGKLVEVNQAFADMHGYTVDDLKHMDIRELDVLRETTLSDCAEIMERIHSGEVVRFEAEHFHKDGRIICLNITTSLIQVGDKTCFLAFHQDITGRKQMEARLLEAQKIESIGTLAGGIAHDFNNLLFPIIGLSEMLMEDLPKGSVEYENAEEIFKAAQRAGDLVKQILSFSRQSDHRKTPVRIQHILKEVLKLIRATIPSNIVIHNEIQSNCGLVMADPTQIHQVAMNLITNAYHAVENKGGTITVSLEGGKLVGDDVVREPLRSREHVILTVSDNGCGIDPSAMIKIFEPYFTTKPKGKGTGLGLSVVYGIVKDHGGDIQVKSEPGKGASFIVYLPLMARTQEAPMVKGPAESETGNERILLVDDEDSVAYLETQMLKKLGYEVTGRTSSVDALSTFRTNPDRFDLVITDMTMPNMTGDRLAAELLSIKPDVPIIICTGFSEKLSEEKAISIGIKGFLMKPVVRSDMAMMVRKVLDARK